MVRGEKKKRGGRRSKIGKLENRKSGKSENREIGKAGNSERESRKIGKLGKRESGKLGKPGKGFASIRVIHGSNFGSLRFRVFRVFRGHLD